MKNKLGLTTEKESFLISLSACLGIVETACQKSNITRDAFDNWFNDDEDFRRRVNKINETSVDFAEKSLLSQINDGNSQATIFYLKSKGVKRGYGEDKDGEIKTIKEEVMVYLISTAETKTQVLKNFVNIFKVSAGTAEEFYKKILIERRLLSPNERIKREEKISAESLVEKFKAGELGEIQMYKKLMEIHLKDTEQAEYPSERQRATEKVIDIQRRLDEIAEREMRKESESMIDVSVKVDSLLLGCSYDQVLEKSQIFLEVEEIEDAD